MKRYISLFIVAIIASIATYGLFELTKDEQVSGEFNNS